MKISKLRLNDYVILMIRVEFERIQKYNRNIIKYNKEINHLRAEGEKKTIKL